MNLTYEQMFENVDISTYENCKVGNVILFNGKKYKISHRNNNDDLYITTLDHNRKKKTYSIHNLIWCYYNNSVHIPENKRIIFLDHDKQNVSKDNLRLVSDIMTEKEFHDIDLRYKYFDEEQVSNCKLGDRIFVYDRTYIVVDTSNGRCKNSNGIILIYKDINDKRRYTRISLSSLLDSYYEYMYYNIVVKRIL